MTQTATTVAQLRVDSLPALYTSLTAALSEAGLSSRQLEEIFSNYVSAECVLCSPRITGEEIRTFDACAPSACVSLIQRQILLPICALLLRQSLAQLLLR